MKLRAVAVFVASVMTAAPLFAAEGRWAKVGAADGFRSVTLSSEATAVATRADSISEHTPVITSVQGRQATVRVPDGFHSVTLQVRTWRKGRPWMALETYLCDGRACDVTFTMRAPWPRRYLRVISKQQPVVPNPFLHGLSNFLAGTAASVQSGSALTLSGATTASASTLSLSSTDAAPRTVTESDIWKLSGDRLYFFNQYRGLQVLDVSNPDAPVLLGQLRLPAQGDQLYELPGGFVALLTRKWGFSGDNGEIVICDVSSGQPAEVARLPYSGSLRESRLVGTALYIAVDRYSYTANAWQQQTVVIGFDLADPAHPVQRNETPVAPSEDGHWSWAAAIWANERHFLVSNVQYASGKYVSTVSNFDISSPDGTVNPLGSVTVDGSVSDKFKLNESGDTLSVISYDQQWGWGSTDGVWFNTQKTVLTNFDITDAAHPQPLGTLTIGEGERTFATRFDGDRIYVVTAIQHDPLWIIDNADPANPALTGHLDVPGFSTYIEPLGDRLVTVGRLTGLNDSGVWQNRTTVSLYDVADAANSQLLSQLPVGGDWSNSEANWNEKAFTVLPEDNLIMLPFSESWGWWGGRGSGAIQIVDLQRDALVLRGVIQHGFTPRRSAVRQDTVLALSSRDLLSVDITDRDHPEVKSDIILAWSVNRVWNSGNYIVELDQGRSSWWWSDGSPNAGLVISPAESPDEIINTFDLGNAPLLAAEVRDNLLYIAQGGVPVAGSNVPDPAAAQGSLTIYDLASLPQVIKRGSVDLIGVDPLASFGWQLLWPKPEVLVLASRGNNYWWGGPITILGGVNATLTLGNASSGTAGSNLTLASASASATSASGVLTSASSATSVASTASIRLGSYWGYGWGPERHLAFNVADPDLPIFLNETKLAKDRPVSFSEAFADDGKIFVSRYCNWYPYPILYDTTESSDTTNPVRPDDINRHMLEVVDYADSTAPVVRPPASLPGELHGISRHGTILYTTGPGYDADGVPDFSRQLVHASAYDGSVVHLVDTIPFASYGGDIHLAGETLYVRQNDKTWNSDGSSIDHSRIEAWTLFDDGKFALLGQQSAPAWASWALYADVLAVLENDSLHASDIHSPGQFLDLGTIPLSGAPLYPITGGDGDRARGLWLPTGDYGVERVKFPN